MVNQDIKDIETLNRFSPDNPTVLFTTGMTEKLVNKSTVKKGAYTDFKSKTLTPRQLLKHVSKGFGFSVAKFIDGKRREDSKPLSWKLLHVDIDGKDNEQNIQIQDILDICSKHGIEPTLIYPTHSYSPDSGSFRVIVNLHMEVLDETAYKSLNRRFVGIFTAEGVTVDSACVTDTKRIYYGNNRIASEKLETYIGTQEYQFISTIQALPDLILEIPKKAMPLVEKGERISTKTYRNPKLRNHVIKIVEQVLEVMPKTKSRGLKLREWYQWFYGLRNWVGGDTRVLDMLLDFYSGSEWSGSLKDIENMWFYTYEKEPTIESAIAEQNRLNAKPHSKQEASISSFFFYARECGYIHKTIAERNDVVPDRTISLDRLHPDFEFSGKKFELIKSGMGTGKTFLIGRIAEEFPELSILFISHRVKLLRATEERFKGLGFGFYSDFDNEEIVKQPRLIITLKSLHKVSNCTYDLIVVDEVTQLYEDFNQQQSNSDNDESFWKNGDEYEAYEALNTVFDNAGNVVLLDALFNRVIQDEIIRKFGKDNVHTVVNTAQSIKTPVIATSNHHKWIESILVDITEKRKILVIMDSKQEAKMLRSVVERKTGVRTLLISSDQEDILNQNEFIENATKFLDEQSEYVVVIGTPTIATGIDIQSKIDTIYVGMFGTLSIPSATQMTARTRNATNCIVYVSPAIKQRPDTKEQVIKHYCKRLGISSIGEHPLDNLIIEIRAHNNETNNSAFNSLKSYMALQERSFDGRSGSLTADYEDTWKELVEQLKEEELTALARLLWKTQTISKDDYEDAIEKDALTEEIFLGYQKGYVEKIFGGDDFKATSEYQLKQKLALFQEGFHNNSMLYFLLIEGSRLDAQTVDENRGKDGINSAFPYARAFLNLKDFFRLVFDLDLSDLKSVNYICSPALLDDKTKRSVGQVCYGLGVVFDTGWSGKQETKAVTSVLKYLGIPFKSERKTKMKKGERKEFTQITMNGKALLKGIKLLRSGVRYNTYLEATKNNSGLI